MDIPDSSSIVSSNNVPATPTQEHEWDVTGWIPDKPAHWEYGYVIKGQTIGSTREQLSELFVQRGSEISFVWTPETPEPVFPERVPFLIDAFRRIQIREARNAILGGAALLGLGVLLAVGLQRLSFVYRNFLFVFGAFGLAEGIWKYSRSRRYTQEDATIDASAARFTSWLGNKRISGYTFTLAACIVVVTVVQELVGHRSIEAAGLVKPAVRNGEIWRLFTATLMHAGFMHFWMNILALLHFAKTVEQTVERALVPMVFLLSGAVGSVFSVLLYPNTTSVGASGGLMGLLGFITIAAHFDRTKYPPKYVRRMIEAIVLIGAFGLFGFAFIDNAAHLGGLAGGLLLGWFAFRKNAQLIKAQEKLLKVGGLAALLALGGIAVIAIHRMFVDLVGTQKI